MDAYTCQAVIGDWFAVAKVHRRAGEHRHSFNERAKYEHSELLLGLGWALGASWPLFSGCSSVATILRWPDGSTVCYLEVRLHPEVTSRLRRSYEMEAGSDWPLLLSKRMKHDPLLAEYLEQYRLWPDFL